MRGSTYLDFGNAKDLRYINRTVKTKAEKEVQDRFSVNK